MFDDARKYCSKSNKAIEFKEGGQVGINIKTFPFMDSHYQYKTVMRQSYLYHGTGWLTISQYIGTLHKGQKSLSKVAEIGIFSYPMRPIIWANAGISLRGPLGTNLSEMI